MKTRTFFLLALAIAVPAAVPAQQAPAVSPAVPTVPGIPAATTATSQDIAPERLTFADALRRALAANPTVGQARAEVGAAEAQTGVLFAAVLPRVALSGSGIRNSEEASFGEGADSRTVLPANDWNYRLTLSQPIYAGNRERRALQQARAGVTIAREGVLSAEDQVLFATAADYLTVLGADALVDVETQNIGLAQKRLRQAQALFEAGETTRVEALRAETAVKAAERRLAEARQSREAAAGRLRLDMALEGPVVVTPIERPAAAPPAEPALAVEAQARRPEIRQAETAVEVARLEVAKQRGAYLPVLASDGGYVRQRSAFPLDTYGFFALRVNVPLYQGGEVGHRVAVARERQHQAELRLSEVKQAVREQVHQALVALETEETRLSLAREELAASEAEYAQAENLYRAQETTALDFEASERSLAESRRVLVTTRLDRAVAELAAWAAAGMLKPTLLPEGSR